MNTTRREILLSGLTGKNSDLILELGPLHEPIAKKSNHNVHYVDRISHQELLDHYRPQGVDVENIVPLDHVWPPGQDLATHITTERFSYCIASHVIEHVPDLVGWLNQIASVMLPGGVLSLAIPNQQDTFDRNRPLTTTAEVVEAALQKSTTPSPKQVYCHFRNNVDPKGSHTETPAFALHAAQQAAAGVYVDVHCWVFVQSNFETVVTELAEQKLIPFRLLESHGSQGEFFVKLQLPS